MGYRSHALFGITDLEDVTLRLTHPAAIELLDYADRTYKGSLGIQGAYTVYEWDSIKWYDSWKPVATLEGWMSVTEADCEGDPPFEFMRDGEDFEDIAHQGSWDFDFGYGISVGGAEEQFPEENSPQLELPGLL